MNIGIFTHNYPKNIKERKDAGVFVKDFANRLARLHNVFVFSPDFGGKKGNENNIKLTWFDWKGPQKKFGDWSLFNPFSVYYFFKLLIIGSQKAVIFANENKLDYCLSAWSLPSAIFTYWIKRKLGIKYGIWNLGSDLNKYYKIPILRQLIKISLVNADNLFANSLTLARKVTEITNRKCVFLPAVTDFSSDFSGSKEKCSGKTNFVFIGRLEKIKGIDLLISACRLLKKRGINFNLNILGGGSLSDNLRIKTERWGMSDGIHFTGWASEEDIKRYLNISDVLVIPSRSESLPLVMIEAARFKIPIIASGVGDCPFILKKYNLGLDFPKGDFRELSMVMEEMVAGGKERFIKVGDFDTFNHDFDAGCAIKIFLKEI